MTQRHSVPRPGLDPASTPRHDPPARWPQSLADGAPGITLLHIENARTGVGGWATVQQWAIGMTRGRVTAHPDDCGLYRGAPAVAFALHMAGQPAYATALNTLDGHIATVTWHRVARAHERIDRGCLPAMREFDLISGLTGLGTYLLHRHGGGDLLRDVLAYLVRLTEPLNTGDAMLPGWWCADGPSDQAAHQWPGGHGNLGIAHGIAGPLALLSTAMRRGVMVAGQTEAISRICADLDRWRCDSGSRTWWPEVLSRTEWQTSTVWQSGPQRPSWCYGTPGIARAQQLAGLALADPSRQRQAEQTLSGCVTDEDQLAHLGDASLCHGWAGLLHTALRVAADGRSDGELATHLPRLHARLEGWLHRNGWPAHDGFLEGATGVRLAQHAAADGPPITGWDACLLLAG